jgi:glycosyltransferase involved in cell wall biosynthesis
MVRPESPDQQAMHRIARVRDELASLLPQGAFVKHKSVAVLIPCYDEATTIAGVIEGFRRVLPGASIYVYDNNSTDGTAEVAAAAGAQVRRETYQGKGNVVRRMFADIDADVYVLADGDLTYDAAAAGRLVETLIAQNVDMVVGVRVGAEQAFRRGHRFGNRLFNRIVARLFGPGFTDILSGYRVVSRRFAKSFPAASSGFEIETELSIHALDLKLATAETALTYSERPQNSASKLKTFRDGARILAAILLMYKALKPLQFFGVLFLVLVAASLAIATPVIVTYLETGLVPRLPTAILAASIMQLAFLSLFCGIVIEAISATRRELKRMRYLELPAPGRSGPERGGPSPKRERR